jgi:hypothetical protein
VPRLFPSRYATVFVVVATAQILDLVTFIPAVARAGVGAESNPLARALYLSAGAWGASALKAVAIAIMVLILARVVRRFPAYALPAVAFVTGIGLFGAASNVLFGLLR